MTDSTAPALWPTEVAALYGIDPDDATLNTSSVTVGLVAMGGGYSPTDLAKALGAMKRPTPRVERVSVRGGQNNFQNGTSGDAEVALDLQIISSLISAGRILIYFAENNLENLAFAIRQPVINEQQRPNVLSISLGRDESVWRSDQRAAVEAALQLAVKNRVTVVAASGDYLANDGIGDGSAHVLFPASHPTVFACGGTRLTLSSNQQRIIAEEVWNNQLKQQGTGGGISDLYNVPTYQEGLGLPPSLNSNRPGGRFGRGLPDFAAAADSTPGYRIVLNGQQVAQGGTSAAAPLWASIISLAIARRGGQPLGDFHSSLYSAQNVCRPIIQGNNRVDGVGYFASGGQKWNACSGLGVPNGMTTIESLAKFSP